jgi:uncharacterized protein (TIGR02246 family)
VTVRLLIDELIAAWQANDAHRAAAFFAVDARYHESGRAPIDGREAIFAHFERFFRSGPPWRIELDEIVVEGERAAVAFEFATATSGTWQTREGCALVRCEDGLVASWREYHG